MCEWSNDGDRPSAYREQNRKDGRGEVKTYHVRSPSQLRIHLLAKKYGKSKLSVEEQARLTIITEKLRGELSHVTEQDAARLETVAKEVRAAADLQDRLKAKYGV